MKQFAWLALLLIGASGWTVARASGYQATDWESGADGYESALRDARRHRQPMIVYFNTTWCPWCRKLNEQYLPHREVQGLLRDFVKVAVNPEDGSSERSVFDQFGGGGYPGFFIVLPVSNSQPLKLSPFKRDGPWSPERFAQEIRERVAIAYERSGEDLVRQKAFEGAIQDFETALEWTERRHASIYFNIGRCYHTQANQQDDRSLAARARANYEKALSHDPNHEPSRKGIDILANWR